MPTYLSPGVYVEETDSGSRPIEGVGTAVAAFVGLAEKGPFNRPILISNWTQFTKTFGFSIDGACLAESVYAYFQNGGGNSYIVRIGDGAGENGSSGSQPQIEATPQGVLANYRVLALDRSTPPDSVRVEVANFHNEVKSSRAGLKPVVYRDGQVVEEHPNVSTSRGKTNVATVVNAGSQVVKLKQISGKPTEELHAGMQVALAAPSAVAVADAPEFEQFSADGKSKFETDLLALVDRQLITR